MFGLSSLALAGEMQQKLTAESTIEQAMKRAPFERHVHLCPLGHEG
jgi:hypothetical protein